MALKKALLIIFLSMLVTASTWFAYQYIQRYRMTNDQYTLTAIIQSSTTSHYLETGLLAEILELSSDKPKNLYRFSITNAQERLNALPMVKKAILKKHFPSILYIEYTLRIPVAMIADLDNTAIDREGVLFPLDPFYKNTPLPKIYLGLRPGQIQWGSQIQNNALLLAFELIDRSYQSDTLLLEQVDTSLAYADSREIVVTYNHYSGSGWSPLYLRTTTPYYDKSLENFSLLYPSQIAQKSPSIIDMRLSNIAYIQR